MAGVVIVPEDMSIGFAVEELATLIACSEPETWREMGKIAWKKGN
jgi:hypothetical protein